jgi:hypothetical protein
VEATGRVSEGAPSQSAGISFETLEVAVTLTAGASGTQTVVLVHGGQYDGLALKSTGDYARGTESVEERVTLIGLD